MSRTPYVPGPTLRRKISEFGYLNVKKTGLYRPILRYFLLQHDNHRHWLPEGEILRHVREHFDEDYSLDECRRDLDALAETRNLLGEFDDEEFSSLDEYDRRARRYQLTPYGLRIERFVAELETSGTEGGSLDTTLLDRLWARVTTLRALLEVPDEEVGRDHLSELHGAWEDAHDYYTRTRESAADYLGNIQRLRPSDLGERKELLAYKRTLTEYLTDFINDLSGVADRIQGLTERWAMEGANRRLADRLARARVDVFGDPARDLTHEDVRTEVLDQLDHLRAWFAEGGDVDHLRRRTTQVIGTVLQNVKRLVERGRGGMSRRRNLEQVAAAFSRQDSLADAHRLFGLVFGPPVPRHVLGNGSRTTFEVARSVWDQEPVAVGLDPIARGQSTARGPSPVRDRSEEQRRHLEELKRKEEQERALFDRIFEDGDLDLAGLTIEDAEVRDEVLDILNACLVSPNNRVVSDAGPVIELVAPDELSDLHPCIGPDGQLWMPGYRLRRLDGEAA